VHRLFWRSHAVTVALWAYGLLGLCAACGSSPRSVQPVTDAQAPDDAPPPIQARLDLTTLSLLAGQPGGRGYVDGPLVAAHFQEPWEIVGDGAHTLYVADANVVRAIDQSTGIVSTLAGTYGHPGSSDGVGTAATFSLPSGFAYANGILYLSDTENLIIRQIEIASGTVTTIAGQVGVRGTTDGPALQALFGEPEGIALDGSGNMYISDTDNNLIRVLNLNTSMVSTLAGGGPSVSALADGIGTAAAFDKPKAMRIDAEGNLYVCDAFNTALRKVVPSTAAVMTLATFQSVPQGIAVEPDGLLVTLAGESGDNRIVLVGTDGTVTTVAGSATMAGFVDGVGTAALFSTPAGLFDDGSGSLFIADSANFAIREMTIATANVVTYAGAESMGSADGVGSQARFSAPQGLATDGTTAYVADTGTDTIRAIEIATGNVTTLAGAAGKPGNVDGSLLDARFSAPQGLALDGASHTLYVGDMFNRVIRQIDLVKGVVSTLSYDTGPGFVGLDGPSGLAVSGGDLFVADSEDDDVVSVNLQNGLASGVAGQFNQPGTEDGVGADAGFYTPTGVTADGLGNLYVADNQASTVRKIVVASDTVSTIAGSPNMPGYQDGVGAMAFFAQPFAVSANDLGDLFVSDTNNNAVRHVALSSGTVTTVIGSPALPGVKLGPLPAQITRPSAIALTPQGALLLVSENSVLIAH
jgi:sugar lactone lactonase YvrE